MTNNNHSLCPICNNKNIKEVFTLHCGNFDNSKLYETLSIASCNHCGHIFNSLTPQEYEGLLKYYNKEYSPSNIKANDKTGDRPGSNNRYTHDRYDQLYNFISSYINNDNHILDIGCALGGFLNYLQNKEFKYLSGIDITESYVNSARKNTNYNIKTGSAESIPFEDNFFNVLIMDQVLEHSFSPQKVFKEAKRVLSENGLFCIGVPDTYKYNDKYFFDYFWFLMREHIQHFDIEHLNYLAMQEGFELVNYKKSDSVMMSEKMILPNLTVLYRLTNKTSEIFVNNNNFDLKKQVQKYFKNESEKLRSRKQFFDNILMTKKPLYVWGIGREFLYLLENTALKECNIAGLIDINSFKQNNLTVNGKKIYDKTILKSATIDSIIIICAVAHSEAIENELHKLGYPGQIVTLESKPERLF